jgi:hypothetical protein
VFLITQVNRFTQSMHCAAAIPFLDLAREGSLISPEAFKHATIEVGKAQKATCQVTRMGDRIIGGRLDRIRLIVNLLSLPIHS